MIDVAYAMAQPAGEGSDMNTLLIFVVFYLLLIRPQQKKAKDQRSMLENLKKGDSVLTQGGIFGKIAGVDGQVVTLEIADKVRVRVAKSHIQGLSNVSDDQNP